MDWKTFITSFGLIFLAELGDKTQLASITLVSSTQRPWAVFFGATLALAVVTLIGVLFGEALVSMVPKNVLHNTAGALFVIIGVLMLAGKF